MDLVYDSLIYSAVAPPEIQAHPDSVNIDVGGTATFTVVASGEGLTYQWFSDETPLADIPGKIAGVTSAALRIFNVQADDFGNYQVRVSNTGGFVNSNVATLTISKSFCSLIKHLLIP